jgi:nucleoside-diphosphate-sugar epimerase
MMKSKYLVTGGTGFIGAALVRRLVSEGRQVRVLDNDWRGSSNRLADLKDRLEIVTGDVRDPQIVRQAARGVDAVLHLAFVNGTELFYSHPRLVLDVGVRGMLNVLDACEAEGIKELVLASSSEVYQSPPAVPTDETAPLSVPDPLNPRYSYGGGKIISELLALNWGRSGFDRVLIFRPHNVYGPDMGWEHVLPQFVLRMKELNASAQGNEIVFPIQGSGQETRAFCHIDDFVDGIMVMLAKGQHLNIYHVGTDEELTIGRAAELVGAFYGKSVSLQPGPLQLGGTLRRCPDITKLKQLGYSPKISLADGLPSLAKWYDANAHLARKPA